jgi:hypothetical protein
MDCQWRLRGAEFDLTRVAQFTGVQQDTQRQWLSRGLLGQNPAPDGRVGLRMLAGIMAIRDCAAARLTADSVRSILPAFTAAVLLSMAVQEHVRRAWAMKVSGQSAEAFTGWENEVPDLVSRVRMLLGFDGTKAMRFGVLSPTLVTAYESLNDIAEEHCSTPVVILDAELFARRIKAALRGSLFLLERL